MRFRQIRTEDISSLTVMAAAGQIPCSMMVMSNYGVREISGTEAGSRNPEKKFTTDGSCGKSEEPDGTGKGYLSVAGGKIHPPATVDKINSTEEKQERRH